MAEGGPLSVADLGCFAFCLLDEGQEWQQWWQPAFMVANGTDRHTALCYIDCSPAIVRGMKGTALMVVGLCWSLGHNGMSGNQKQVRSLPLGTLPWGPALSLSGLQDR